MVSALEFHDKTKHSPENIRKSGWRMNFENKPFPFKVYTDENPIFLPNDFTLPEYNGLQALIKHTTLSESIKVNKSLLTTLLFYTGGVSRIMHNHFMRTASATGALYPIEIYVVVQHTQDIKDGVYHFSVGDFSLSLLRKGNYQSFVAQNTSDPDSIMRSSITIILSSYGWKNSWKYQTRSYRHWYWDGGVMLANLLACSNTINVESKVITAFIDDKINKLIGLHDNQEAVIAIVPIINNMEKNNVSVTQYEPLEAVRLESLRLSPKEINFPLIWEIHKITSLTSQSDLEEWNKKIKEYKNFIEIPKEENLNIDFKSEEILSIEKSILQRGSTNRFTTEPLAKNILLAILRSSNSGTKLDIFPNRVSTTIECYLNVHNVEGLEEGAYYYNSTTQELEVVREEQVRQKTTFLCLGQDLFGSCQVTIFLVTNLAKLVNHFGDRAYRVAQLEAGIVVGKIYLSAFATKIGARGTTFFDDEVMNHFSPHANGKDVMMAVGVGIPAYKAKPGKKLCQLFSRRKLLAELDAYLQTDGGYM